jgi:hypothetical protein
MRLITKKIPTTVFALFACVQAYAVCNQTSASQADRDFWATHGCNTGYFLWQYRAYDFRSGDWGNRGFFDACNQNLEYPKAWSSSYLVNYGLLDNYSQSWHGTVDYAQLAYGPASNYHDDSHYEATDDTDIYGRYLSEIWIFRSRHIELACSLFNASDSHGNPASRASDFMHESWHGWLDKHGYQIDHFTNPAGGHCTLSGNNCDYFYWHGVSAYLFGDLYQTDGTANRFHSPNQVQVEFLCDVSDQPQSWVPASVRTAAAADANYRADTRFINGPAAHCGTPRPW